MQLSARELLVVLGIVCAGCGGGSGGSGSPTSPSPSAPAANTININGQNGTQAFSPNPSTFAGQMVAFKNNDSVAHRVVLNDGSVDTGNIAPGATSQAVLMPGGGTNYHCSIHPGMIGSVSGNSGAPPACTGSYCDPY
jgi:plastocyanin